MPNTSSWTKLRKGKYDWLYKNNQTNLTLLQKFIDDNGFVSVSKTRTYTTIKWFLENGKDVGHPDKYRRFTMDSDKLEHPIADHDYYFKLKSGECVYVLQPYMEKEVAEEQIKVWAEKHGVKAIVYDKEYSWYYPNNSLLIVVSLPNTDAKININ